MQYSAIPALPSSPTSRPLHYNHQPSCLKLDILCVASNLFIDIVLFLNTWTLHPFTCIPVFLLFSCSRRKQPIRQRNFNHQLWENCVIMWFNWLCPENPLDCFKHKQQKCLELEVEQKNWKSLIKGGRSCRMLVLQAARKKAEAEVEVAAKKHLQRQSLPLGYVVIPLGPRFLDLPARVQVLITCPWRSFV